MFYNTTGFINYSSDEGIIHVKGLIIYKDNASGKDSARSQFIKSPHFDVIQKQMLIYMTIYKNYQIC